MKQHLRSTERNKLSTQNSILSENVFQKWRRNNCNRQTKTERIHYQKTYATRNTKWGFIVRRNMMPDRTLDLPKEMKIVRNGTNECQIQFFFFWYLIAIKGNNV